MPILLDNPVWKISSEVLDSDGKVKLEVEKKTSDACDACWNVKVSFGCLWFSGSF